MLKFVRFILCCFFLSFGLFADHDQFGLCTNDFPAEPQQYEGSPSEVLFKQLNINWIRGGIPWNYIETIAGQYNFSEMDEIFTYAQKHDINILGGLGSTPNGLNSGPNYGNGKTTYLDPLYINKWTAFITAMVERYDGDGYMDMPGTNYNKPVIKYWEIWNEPNLGDFWTGTLAEFCDNVLLPGIAAIKAADPQAKICGPGESQLGSPRNYFDDLTTRMGGVKFDILTYHPYGDDAAQSIDLLEKFYVNAEDDGYVNPEFWITEIGWPIANPKAALYMREMLNYMLANKNWLKKTFWFAYRDTNDIMPFILYNTNEPTALYYTFKSYTNPPSLTVVSPNGGEVWVRGKTYSIQWTSNDVTNIKIELIKGTVVDTPITPSTSASIGLFDWTISAAPGTNYKIIISEINSDISLFDSSNANFTIGDVPDKPTLNSPADNASLCTTAPTFSWYAVTAIPVVDYYQLVINNADGSRRHTSPNLTSTSYTPPAGTLQSGTKYSWYVRAHNSAGWGSFSGRTLNISVFSLPAKPVLNSPANNATVTTTRPTFTWSIVAGCPAVDYCQVQINYNGAKLYASGNLTGTSFTVPANILAKGKTYAWYVRTHNSVGWSGWSGRTIKIK